MCVFLIFLLVEYWQGFAQLTLLCDVWCGFSANIKTISHPVVVTPSSQVTISIPKPDTDLIYDGQASETKRPTIFLDKVFFKEKKYETQVTIRYASHKPLQS